MGPHVTVDDLVALAARTHAHTHALANKWVVVLASEWMKVEFHGSRVTAVLCAVCVRACACIATRFDEVSAMRSSASAFFACPTTQ